MVTINIEKRDIWIISAIFIFIAGASFVVAYNSGATPSVMGHSGEELEINVSGKIMSLQQAVDLGMLGGNSDFGNWTNLDSEGKVLIKNSVYQATSDGFISQTGHGGSTFATTIIAYVDSVNPPEKIIIENSGGDRYFTNGFVIPVPKDSYWSIYTGGASALDINWIPIGNGKVVRQP